MTTGKTIALTRWTFVGKVMPLLFNLLSRLIITFLPRRDMKNKCGNYNTKKEEIGRMKKMTVLNKYIIINFNN